MGKSRRRVTIRLPDQVWAYVQAELDRNPHRPINDILCELIERALLFDQ